MLKLLQALFGKKTVDQVELTVEASTPKSLEFHEEIRQQVEAEKPFPVEGKKPAVKAKSVKAKKPAAKKAPAKITAEKKPAKKSKKQ